MPKDGGEGPQIKTWKALGFGKSPENLSGNLCGGASNLTAMGTRTTLASWIGLDSRGMMLLAHTKCTPYVNIKKNGKMAEMVGRFQIFVVVPLFTT